MLYFLTWVKGTREFLYYCFETVHISYIHIYDFSNKIKNKKPAKGTSKEFLDFEDAFRLGTFGCGFAAYAKIEAGLWGTCGRGHSVVELECRR